MEIAKNHTIQIGKSALKLADYHCFLSGEDPAPVSLSTEGLQRVRESYEFLQQFSKGKVIYGVNTGLGPMAPYILSHSRSRDLQYNLIRSHASGMGSRLPVHLVRALMLTRLNTLMLGKSGVHPDTVELLAAMLSHGIYPCVYMHGGVGASGDLVQLAHLALGMIGEGEVHYQGRICAATEALAAEGLKPMQIYLREGLAIMNGTAVMTGVGAVNVLDAFKLLGWSLVCSSMLNEVVEAYSDAFSAPLNEAKLHPGQQKIALEMRKWLEGSSLIRNRAEHMYDGSVPEGKTNDKVQEYYSVRCIPQILGPVYDAIHGACVTVLSESNSASDNPVVSVEDQNIYHGGNFHGDYVSFEMDKLKIAVIKLSMLAERQINYMLNSSLNLKLPPFLNRGELGLNFGLQGVQFTATSTVAENQSLASPVYIHSIPCNNDNQDIVSMGANAAHLAHTVITNTFDVIAIELVAIAEAIQHLNIADRLSPRSAQVYSDLRNAITLTSEDIALSGELRQLAAHLAKRIPPIDLSC